jgi:endonuclease/exonuclease/phosphatase family metal-dependent hydrolase
VLLPPVAGGHGAAARVATDGKVWRGPLAHVSVSQVRVMTWNVWGRFGAWRERERAIVDTLRSAQSDLLALQETWRTSVTTQAEVLGTELGLHATYAQSRMPVDSDPDVELGVALLSRWPLSDVQVHRLPSEQVPATIALMAHVDHPAGRLHFATTCLDWEQDHSSHRLAQSHALEALFADTALDGRQPVVLAGDLNAPPDSAEIQALTATMADCWARGTREPGYTYSAGNPHIRRGDWHTDSRIDYVLARPGTPGRAVDVQHVTLAGLNAADGLPVPSDHYAVVVDLP